MGQYICDVIICNTLNACLTSWRTLMVYFVLSRNGEECFNKFLCSDTDDYREGLSHGYNTSCVKH